MKTNRLAGPRRLLLGAALLSAASMARCEIPEPDNLLYGTIVIDNQVITPARTDVVIEARRTPGGPAIASYRMGTLPGSFYRLALQLESGLLIAATNASRIGDTVHIVVRDATGDRGQTTYTFPERGQVQRVDFGSPVGDGDGNGLPDAWELAHFGNTGQNPDAINPNGQSTRANFIAGSAPNDTNTLYTLAIVGSGPQVSVSFLARRAEGPGYEGRSRFYTLESSTNVGGGSWVGVAGFSNILGNNQTVGFQTMATNRPVFHRGRVVLTPP